MIIFEHTNYIGARELGWGRYEFFIFLATTWFTNSLVQAFFMPNAQEFSERDEVILRIDVVDGFHPGVVAPEAEEHVPRALVRKARRRAVHRAVEAAAEVVELARRLA